MDKGSSIQISLMVLLVASYYVTFLDRTSAQTDYKPHFNCTNGRNMPGRLRCNEVDDCSDGGDETECFPQFCANNQFKCFSSGKCIPSAYICDGAKDCQDGSDEQQCPCPKDKSRCRIGGCIKKIFRCDGTRHCPDSSDEGNCQQCSQIAFTCQRKFQCVPRLKLCDGINDCDDKTDEKDCKSINCNEHQFPCRHGACIPQDGRCNKTYECEDWSDEANCSECPPHLFTCTSGECIDRQGICNSSSECVDESDENNCSYNRFGLIGGAPSFWLGTSFRATATNTRTNLEQNEEFTDHKDLVVYFDTNVIINNTLLSFLSLGKAWAYVRETYGQFGPDPRLYLILYNNENPNTITNNTTPSFLSPNCITRTYLETSATNKRNIIECENMESNNWDLLKNFDDIRSLYKYLGELVLKVFKIFDVSVFFLDLFLDVLIYDIYLYIHGQDESITEWKNRKFEKDGVKISPDDIPIKDFLSKLYFQNYEGHDRTSLVNNFNVLNTVYRPDVLPIGNYPDDYRLGCVVHFLNGAVGFEWTLLINKLRLLANPGPLLLWYNDFRQCKLQYPNFIYAANEEKRVNIPARNWLKTWRGHNDKLTLAYANEHVAFYFKNFKIYSIDNFDKISQYWSYIKSTYGPFGSESDSYINIILHDKVAAGTTCTSSNDRNYNDTEFDGRHVIDCGPMVHENWNLSRADSLDEIIIEMAKMALKLSRGYGNWPARKVSGWSMASIIVYDMYKAMDLQRAESWKTRKTNETESNNNVEIRWFTDWYLHIYEGYKGPVALNKFLDILNETWPKDGPNYKGQLNMGQFVLAWSRAVRKDLYMLAKSRLPTDAIFEEELREAKMEMPGLFSTDSNMDTNETQTTYTVVGISAGILALILVGFGIKLVMYRRRIANMDTYIRNLTTDEINEFYKGRSSSGEKDAHASIHALPFSNSYEIPEERLIVDDSFELGSGEYGVVKQGILKGDPSAGTVDMDVAVKMVKPNVDVSYFKALLSEIKIMAYLGSHSNIASLLGTRTHNIRSREVYIVLEFCANGDLHTKLKSLRKNFQDLFNNKIDNDSSCHFKNDQDIPSVTFEPSGSIVESPTLPVISTLDLLEWSIQIADGMNYMSSKNVIHGDLAARNVLLTADNIAKVSDFGLSRQLINYTTYMKTSKVGFWEISLDKGIPFRSMAIESLNDMEFSIQSDIWSYGVTLWEIFTLGKTPYAGRTWDPQFVADLVAGQRLNSPDFGNTDIYNIMLGCMRNVPSERITFPQIRTQLDRIKASLASDPIASTSQSCGNYMSLE